MVRKYLCAICKGVYNELLECKRCLLRHIEATLRQRSIKACPFCNTVTEEFGGYAKCIRVHQEQTVKEINSLILNRLKKQDGRTCRHCNKSFSIKFSMYKHLKETHNEVAPKLRTETKKPLINEKNKKKVRTKSKKPSADKKTSQPIVAESSLKPGRDFMWKCTVCGFEYEERSTVVAHMKESHDYIDSDIETYIETVFSKTKVTSSESESFICNVCSSKFNSKEAYQRCLNNHLLELEHVNPISESQIKENLACSLCDESFERPQFLRNHMRLVHANNPLQCEKCYMTCDSNKELILHYRWCGKKRAPQYICHFCTRSFTKRSSFIAHVKERHIVDLVKCDSCQKSFKNSYFLDQHLINGCAKLSERQFCTVCDRYVTNLQLHSARHGNEQVYKCKTCDKSFKQATALYMHNWKPCSAP